MNSEFFKIGTKVQLYPGDTHSKYGVIKEINELGWVIQITEADSRSEYKKDDIFFLSHSKSLSMRIAK